MARTRATTYCTIHGDPEWLALTPAAKLVYLTINSQATVSLAGCLDYNPAKWAKLTGYRTGDVEEAITELIEARFLAVDEETFECVIRTFTKWDIGELANKNTIAGMWSAWRSILSPALRQVVLDSMPPKLRATGDPSTDGTTVETVVGTVDAESEVEEQGTCRSNDVPTADGTVDGTGDGTGDGTAVPTTSSSSSSGTATSSNSNAHDSTASNIVPLPDASPPASVPVRQSDFDAFWERYPRKVGKPKAQAAYRQARKRSTVDEILTGLDRHLPAWRRLDRMGNGDKIPHPTTWLNRDGWGDDPPPTPSAGRPNRPAENRAKIAASLARMGGAS